MQKQCPVVDVTGDVSKVWYCKEQYCTGTWNVRSISSVSSVTQSCPTLCDPMNYSTPGSPVHHQLPELVQTHVHWVSHAIQASHLCHPLLLPPSIFPSIRVFSSESALHIRWPKYCSFSFNISPSSEHPGPISFRRLVGSPCSPRDSQDLLQQGSTKASVLWHSAFCTVQLSHPYMNTGKTIALTRWTSVGKVMSLLSNMLSRLVTAFLPRSKRLLISWLQSPYTMIFQPKKLKSLTDSHVSRSICHEVMGPDAMNLVLWMLTFKPVFSLCSFTFIKRLSSSLSAIRVVLSAYLKLLILLPAILIPACASSSPAFRMM